MDYFTHYKMTEHIALRFSWDKQLKDPSFDKNIIEKEVEAGRSVKTNAILEDYLLQVLFSPEPTKDIKLIQLPYVIAKEYARKQPHRYTITHHTCRLISKAIENAFPEEAADLREEYDLNKEEFVGFDDKFAEDEDYKQLAKAS